MWMEGEKIFLEEELGRRTSPVWLLVLASVTGDETCEEGMRNFLNRGKISVIIEILFLSSNETL